jgi:hypothetical protein
MRYFFKVVWLLLFSSYSVANVLQIATSIDLE